MTTDISFLETDLVDHCEKYRDSEGLKVSTHAAEPILSQERRRLVNLFWEFVPVRTLEMGYFDALERDLLRVDNALNIIKSIRGEIAGEHST
ncbi:hypothetical protein [Thioalkalivibrio thiocyanodenitrificans]|uniref:hypothetical protein n=1 Tax=Thioalkalivibrio thiocyanodenitrificans TaxID=243063 RepID=UPI00036AA260|nr:hypothetical protein [Thioalkalivibrio thiocyanodenitrificans]